MKVISIKFRFFVLFLCSISAIGLVTYFNASRELKIAADLNSSRARFTAAVELLGKFNEIADIRTTKKESGSESPIELGRTLKKEFEKIIDDLIDTASNEEKDLLVYIKSQFQDYYPIYFELLSIKSASPQDTPPIKGQPAPAQENKPQKGDAILARLAPQELTIRSLFQRFITGHQRILSNSLDNSVEELEMQYRRDGATTIIMVAILALLTIYIARRIYIPIKNLRKKVDDAALGKFPAEWRTPLLAADDVGLLVKSLQALKERLQKMSMASRERQAILESIADRMNDALLIVRPKMGIQYSNGAAQRLLGYTKEELLAKPAKVILEGNAKPHGSDGFSDLIKMDTGEFIEKSLFHKDGTQIPILFTTSIIRHDDDIHSIVCIAIDISPLRRMQEELAARTLELDTTLAELANRETELLDEHNELTTRKEELATLKAEFELKDTEAATLRADLTTAEDKLDIAQEMEAVNKRAGEIAREITSVWDVINGNAIMLRESDGDKTELEAIENAANKGALLTKELVGFADGKPIEPETIDVNELASSAIDKLSSVCPYTLTVHAYLDSDLWQIKGNREQIENIIFYLLHRTLESGDARGGLAVESKNVVIDKRTAKRLRGLECGAHVKIRIVNSENYSPEDKIDHRKTKPVTGNSKEEVLRQSIIRAMARTHKGAISMRELNTGRLTCDLYFPRFDETDGSSIQGATA